MLKDSTYLLFVPPAHVSSAGADRPHAAINGFNGLDFPSLPQSENWVFCVLLGLFFLLIFAIRVYPSLITEDLFSIFRKKERSSLFSNPEGSDSRLRVLYIFFAICAISLYAYLVMFSSGAFSFLKYVYFTIVTTVFFLLKGAFICLICCIFSKNKSSMALRSYYNLLIFFGLALFPLLIINIYANGIIIKIVYTASLIVCSLTTILVVLKLFQIFFSKSLDFFYILLYLCTLEILPVLALFQMYKLIV